MTDPRAALVPQPSARDAEPAPEPRREYARDEVKRCGCEVTLVTDRDYLLVRRRGLIAELEALERLLGIRGRQGR